MRPLRRARRVLDPPTERALVFDRLTGDARGGGEWIAAGSDGPSVVRFSEGTSLTLAPSAKLRITETTAHGAAVLLEQGSVEASVVHTGADTQWALRAGPFDVRVTGTRFRAAWDPVGETFEITMREGSVLVRGPVLSTERALLAGEHLRVSVRDGVLALHTSQPNAPAKDAPPAGSAALAEPRGPASAQQPVVSSATAIAIPAPPSPATPAPGVDATAKAADQGPGWRELASAGKYKEAFEATERVGFAQEIERASSADLSTLTDIARFAGRPALAREALLAQRLGGSARGEERVLDRENGRGSAGQRRRRRPLVRDLPERRAARRARRAGAGADHGAHEEGLCSGAIRGGADHRALPQRLVRRAREEHPRPLNHLLNRPRALGGRARAPRGSLALARGETHVLLIGRSEKDPSVKRIEQELRILGLEVEFLPAGKSRGSLADKARARGATAAAEVQTDPPAILLWTDPIRFPDVGGGLDLRIDEGSAGTAEPGLLALRAVELLHGRILPVPAQAGAPLDGGTADAAATTDAGAAPPPEPRPTTEPARLSPFSAFVGPAILTSSSVDPTLHVWLGARVNLATRIDLELAGAIPTTATAVPGVTGTAGARIRTFGLAANFRFTEPASPLFASAGLGIGALVSVVSGDATKASNAALGTRAGALPYLRAGAGYWIASHVALRGDALLGTTLPAPVIKVKSDDVATFGAPTLIFAAALEVRP